MKLEDLKNMVVTHNGMEYRVENDIEINFIGGSGLEVVFYTYPVEQGEEETSQITLLEGSECPSCEG